jgi:hypothetical protein
MGTVGLDRFLTTEPEWEWKRYWTRPLWQCARCFYEDGIVPSLPRRILTESLAAGTPQAARTALRMLGATGTEGHPLWDVLAEGAGS